METSALNSTERPDEWAEFLAIMLGLRRSSVTEVLQALKEQGLVRYKWGLNTILDRKRLEAQCCECYQVVKDEQERLLKRRY